jgi:hypothetical protein
VGIKEPPTYGDKCIDLYSRIKKDQYKDKQNKSHADYEFERMKDECLFTPKINDGTEIQSEIEVHQVKGMDKIMERMTKARQLLHEKKMMTERGIPSQMQAKIGQPDKSMAIGRNTNKFKSGFGQDGSQI